MLDKQLHFSDELVNQIQTNLEAHGETFEQFIMQAVVHELHRRKTKDLKSFIDGIQPLESFVGIDSEAYVDEIRSKSRLING